MAVFQLINYLVGVSLLERILSYFKPRLKFLKLLIMKIAEKDFLIQLQ